MKIGILGIKSSNKSKAFQKFKAAAKLLDMSVEYYRPSDIIIEVNEGTVSILDYNMEPIQVDGIVNWIPYEKKYHEISEAFSATNIPCINNASSVRNCRNKILTNIILSNFGINQPKTTFIPKLSKIPKLCLKTPMVFKKKSGSRGKGARKFDTMDETNEFLQEVLEKKDIYLQEYVKNNGWDMRVIVVGNKVIGGIKKVAKEGEWRTHVAHGGHAESCELNDSIRSICLEATRALELDFAGIDIIQDVDGNYSILEVNSVPGMSIFYEATGINIAYDILRYFKEEILKPSKNDNTSSVNYYQVVPSKMEKTKIIMTNPLINLYIPETLDMNYKNLNRMLKKYPMVVFKPDIGSGGKYVGLIRRSHLPNQYTLLYKTKCYKDMSMDEIIQFIDKLKPRKKFILQKGIDLIKYNNRPVDIRVFVQKPYEDWEITGTIARIAAKNKIVTNVCRNGKGLPLTDFFKNTSYDEADIEKLMTTLSNLTYDVANTLSEVYPGLRELGMDIGLDNNLHPWILEVNTNPHYSKVALFKDQTMYNKIHEYNKIIQDSVVYYQREYNKIIQDSVKYNHRKNN